MSKQGKQTNQQRRRFLRKSAATGAGVVIASTAPAIALAGTAATTDTPSAKSDAGYQLSQHVLDYYKTCAR